jgi:hypothetical protein
VSLVEEIGRDPQIVTPVAEQDTVATRLAT